MQASTMRKSKLGMVVFAAALAAGWMGCAADVTPPDKGPEPVATTSSALTPVPQCGQQQPTTVWAIPHGQYNQAFAPSRYTVSAHSGGESGYAMPCGTPINASTGYMTACGSNPNVYEQDLWSQAYRSNGYAYYVWAYVNQSWQRFVGIGINSSTASPAWSYTPPPPPGHPAGGSPTASDWAAEQSLVSSAPGTDADVQASYLTCVQVLAYDTGNVLDYFPVLDVHDPHDPPW